MWYAVRSVVPWPDGEHHAPRYEERVTIFRADSFEAAVRLAKEESAEYARDVVGGAALGMYQAFLIREEFEDGAEVFSLIRDSDLAPEEYLDHFFDTGRERQGFLE
ncbi:DUF4288 domain-containing protein [Actinocatenispora rupis]|uniref:DUF4288 domain-containing protein n=1 Tax=Actinocatenispora rupis TaxID=519421 RepID=A0A8J3NG66_9ACTN|nr:DUF4288 domain-containing protein [Actinocatenispora rupis]GID16072.1 hypothetical protein Aru02nite_69610 [Actinocatenispora rupis]